eukprot:gene7333-11652_t
MKAKLNILGKNFKFYSKLKLNSLEEFKNRGYIQSSVFFSQQEKENLINWTKEIQNWKEVKGKYLIYHEKHQGKDLLCRIENFIPYHEELSKLVLGKLTDACSLLLEEKAILYKDKINFKLPNGSYAPHQDAPAFHHLAKKKQLSVMIAVDEATTESGCLEFVPGENKQLFPNIDGVLTEEIVKQWEKENKWKPVFAKPGDVIFFDSFVPHRSGQNTSSNPRRNYYLTYNVASEGDLREAYYKDKRINFPPTFEREEGKDYAAGKKIYNVANPIE